MTSRLAVLVFSLATALLSACGGKDEPVDAAPPAEASTVCGATAGYLATCTADSECGSCMCKSFGHSMVCTKACTGPADCPAPSGGCSAGFCRP